MRSRACCQRLAAAAGVMPGVMTAAGAPGSHSIASSPYSSCASLALKSRRTALTSHASPSPRTGAKSPGGRSPDHSGPGRGRAQLAELRRSEHQEITDLRSTVSTLAQHVQAPTLENHALRTALEKDAGVTRISDRVNY